MSPLPLPTDNLSKFCALIGVALCIAIVYFGEWQALDLADRRIRLKLENSKARVEVDYISNLIGRIERIIAEFQSPQSAEELRKQGKLPVERTPEDVARMLERAQELQRDSELKVHEIDSLAHRERLASLNLLLIQIIGSVLLLVGMSLSGFGFRRWRIIQKKQDELLELQLQQSRATKEAS